MNVLRRTTRTDNLYCRFRIYAHFFDIPERKSSLLASRCLYFNRWKESVRNETVLLWNVEVNCQQWTASVWTSKPRRHTFKWLLKPAFEHMISSVFRVCSSMYHVWIVLRALQEMTTFSCKWCSFAAIIVQLVTSSVNVVLWPFNLREYWRVFF